MHLSRFVIALLPLLPCLIQAEEPASGIELQGILVIGNDRRFALANARGDHSGWITLGDSFSDWRVVDYLERENAVVLGRDDQRITVPLRTSAVRVGSPSETKATVVEADEMLGKMRFEAMWDQIAAEQKKAMVGAMRQQATAEFTKVGLKPAEIETLLDRMAQAVVGGMNSEAMRKDFARIYSEVYTKDELQGMAAFYDTAAGQAWNAKQPEVQQKLMQAMMPRVMEGMPAAQKIAADYLRQRGTK
jgi:hypothetical protein